jgi:hypothetical protein
VFFLGFLALLGFWGGLGGYYFYNGRNLLSAAFFGIGLMQILDALDLVHGIREAQRRGQAKG